MKLKMMTFQRLADVWCWRLADVKIKVDKYCINTKYINGELPRNISGNKQLIDYR